MTSEEIRSLYDAEYARSYDSLYLLGTQFIECTEFEQVLLSDLLQMCQSWLDVASGTGYVLSQFPNVRRAGLDLSPAMLAHARLANPGVPFYQCDFRNPMPEWVGQWELVSCMWYAYCYAGSLEGVGQVIGNLIEWTAADGCCFLPVCDPAVLCQVSIPHNPSTESDDGYLRITGVAWEWRDDPSGRRHKDMFAPHVSVLLELFEPHFKAVQLVRYPTFRNDCMSSRSAIIATGKKAHGREQAAVASISLPRSKAGESRHVIPPSVADAL